MDKGWGLTLDSIAISSFLNNKRNRGILESGPMVDSPAADERREVDFFADKRSVTVKKENSHGDEAGTAGLNVNVINLL